MLRGAIPPATDPLNLGAFHIAVPAVKKFTPGLLAILLALCSLLPACQDEKPLAKGYEPQSGDILFQSLPRNPLVDAIEGATASPFSHCGILHRSGAGWMVIEAIGPVRETALSAWTAQARDQRYTVFRLKPPYRDRIPFFVQAAKAYLGLPYDVHYDFDDNAIYCSELVFKAFRRSADEDLGRIQTLGELRWQPHVEVIKRIEHGSVPLHRKMITPRSLSEAQQLERVYSNGA